MYSIAFAILYITDTGMNYKTHHVMKFFGAIRQSLCRSHMLPGVAMSKRPGKPVQPYHLMLPVKPENSFELVSVWSPLL